MGGGGGNGGGGGGSGGGGGGMNFNNDRMGRGQRNNRTNFRGNSCNLKIFFGFY